MTRNHVVMFSGGIGSWATAARVAERHGTERLTLLFADVGGTHETPHAGEDEDVYRFVADAAENIGAELITLNTGLTIWDVFRRRSYLGNSRIAPCSHELKQKPCRSWLDANRDPANTTVYVGIDWTETHRLPAIIRNYAPYTAEAPMAEPPYIDKPSMIALAEAQGLEPPRMYAQGYPHANCGGGCVRAGHKQFKMLLRINPERFAYWEDQEAKFRADHGGDVAILRETAGTVGRPLPLSVLRERIESQPGLFDDAELGGCGCFTDDGEAG